MNLSFISVVSIQPIKFYFLNDPLIFRLIQVQKMKIYNNTTKLW